MHSIVVGICVNDDALVVYVGGRDHPHASHQYRTTEDLGSNVAWYNSLGTRFVSFEQE